jgi:hypothetical protein
MKLSLTTFSHCAISSYGRVCDKSIIKIIPVQRDCQNSHELSQSHLCAGIAFKGHSFKRLLLCRPKGNDEGRKSNSGSKSFLNGQAVFLSSWTVSYQDLKRPKIAACTDLMVSGFRKETGKRKVALSNLHSLAVNQMETGK